MRTKVETGWITVVFIIIIITGHVVERAQSNWHWCTSVSALVGDIGKLLLNGCRNSMELITRVHSATRPSASSREPVLDWVTEVSVSLNHESETVYQAL